MLTLDANSLQPIAAPVSPAFIRQAPVSPVGNREQTQNERRETSRDDRARPNIAFRSFLNAATLAGLTKSLGGETQRSSADSEAPAYTRPSKLPAQKDDTVISANEADVLYRSAQVSGRDGARAPEFLAATSRYAKSFFAVSGTFARPGESLELTA